MWLLRWTSETWGSQGRLMFSALAPLRMWMAVGLWALPLRRIVTGAVIVWFVIAAAVITPLTIRAAYVPSTYVQTTSSCGLSSESCNEASFVELVNGARSATLTMLFNPI